jgi:hypothetical protein
MRTMPFLLLTLLLLPAVPASARPNCGRLPTGENPTVEELDAEMARASATHQVPTEIIKAVAWQESGCQQWRPDGSFVYNTSDCGLGMMQLTGATAEQYDIDQLKDDWRYNLDCGVQVLVMKWNRAQRQGLVPADPDARRVLENWYHPVAFYQGRRDETYLRRIFGHLANRPGRLQQLLRRPVEVSIASEVIPGFSFGDRFVAYLDDRFVDAAGEEHGAPTHQGTIGDPQMNAALETWLDRGRRALERGNTKRALEYLLQIVEADLDTDHTAEARVLLDQIAAEAQARIDEAEALLAEGDRSGALRLLRRLTRDYRGHPAAEQAEARIEELRAGG